MKTQIEIYGRAKDITTHKFEVTKKHTFTLVAENGEEFSVQVLDNNLCYDLNTEDYFQVVGVEGECGIVAGFVDRWGRICSHCGKHHTEGYYSENTGLYACSDECLTHLYTEEEIEEEREQEWLFWTEWE